MKKYFFFLLLSLITFSVFADDTKGEEKPEAQAVMKIFESQSWVITCDHATLANSIQVDDMAMQRNYFSMNKGIIKVNLDFFGARATGAVTKHQAGRMARDLRSTGNTLATLPPNYEATYKVESQEISCDKKGKHVTVRISYSVEDSNVTNMGSTPELEISVSTKDMSCTVNYISFRSGETYFGNLLEKTVIK